MKISFSNWLKVTSFKGLKTFVQTFLSALTVAGIGLANINWQSALMVSTGAFITCIAMYVGMLCWEIVEEKFHIYAKLEDESATDEKINKAIEEALEEYRKELP